MAGGLQASIGLITAILDDKAYHNAGFVRREQV